MLGGMRLLVLGGTAFLGQAVAEHALRAGHDVTCAARGEAGTVPAGAKLVTIDRSTPEGLSGLDGSFDAVVDVARRPSFVRHAVDALGDKIDHWVFVSSCSAYADQSTPGQRAETAKLAEPADPNGDELDPETYGPRKVGCERIILESVGPDRAFICRAGLIVGPHDPFGRYDYWVERLHRGGEVLAPGAPAEAVQWVDVRDLAAWLVEAAQQRLSGAYDGIGAPITRAEFLAGIAAGLGVTPQLTWVPQDFLIERQVQEWFGPRSLPMWVALPQNGGLLARDVTSALAAGLRTRPLAETSRDTLDWLRSRGDAPARPCGLTPAEEAELLADFHRQDSV
jgi:2'-hydroxyisoflavone reductase